MGTGRRDGVPAEPVAVGVHYFIQVLMAACMFIFLACTCLFFTNTLRPCTWPSDSGQSLQCKKTHKNPALFL